MRLPPYFYRVDPIEKLQKALSRGYFEGIEGLSSASNILAEFLWLRGAAVVMPANDMVEINEQQGEVVLPVEYGSVDMLAADNMQVLGRLFNNSARDEYSLQQRLQKWKGYLKEAVRLIAAEEEQPQWSYATPEYLPYRHIGEKVASGEYQIDSSEDLGDILWEEAFSQYSSYDKPKGLGEIIKNRYGDSLVITREDFQKAVDGAFLLAGAQYANEEEWLVLVPRLYIPDDTVVIVSLESGLEATRVWFYKPSTAPKLREWEREEARTYESFGMEAGKRYSTKEFLEMSGIEDNFEVRHLPYAEAEEMRDRASGLATLGDRFDEARSRVKSLARQRNPGFTVQDILDLTEPV